MCFEQPEPAKSFNATYGSVDEDPLSKMFRMAAEFKKYIKQCASYEAMYHSGRWGTDFLNWYTLLES